ncbi:hypothetical protein ACTG9Q_15930 [Actinokineospora sp. 24-640]
MDFSLFYFADDSSDVGEGYRMLLDGAKIRRRTRVHGDLDTRTALPLPSAAATPTPHSPAPPWPQ